MKMVLFNYNCPENKYSIDRCKNGSIIFVHSYYRFHFGHRFYPFGGQFNLHCRFCKELVVKFISTVMNNLPFGYIFKVICNPLIAMIYGNNLW